MGGSGLTSTNRTRTRAQPRTGGRPSTHPVQPNRLHVPARPRGSPYGPPTRQSPHSYQPFDTSHLASLTWQTGSADPAGSIETRPGRTKGKFRAVVFAGTDPLTGRARYLRKSADTYAEAQVELTKLVSQVDERRHPRSAITVGQVIEKWLDVAELADTTRQRYDGLVRMYISPKLGALQAGRLDAETLENFYARLRRCNALCSGRSRDHTCRPLSASMVRQIHFILRAALDRAVRWRYLGVNEAAMASPPAFEHHEPDPPSAEEVAALLNDAWRDPVWGLLADDGVPLPPRGDVRPPLERPRPRAEHHDRGAVPVADRCRSAREGDQDPSEAPTPPNCSLRTGTNARPSARPSASPSRPRRTCSPTVRTAGPHHCRAPWDAALPQARVPRRAAQYPAARPAPLLRHGTPDRLGRPAHRRRPARARLRWCNNPALLRRMGGRGRPSCGRGDSHRAPAP